MNTAQINGTHGIENYSLNQTPSKTLPLNRNESLEAQRLKVLQTQKNQINDIPEILQLDFTKQENRKWEKSSSITDYFNYGFNEISFKCYIELVKKWKQNNSSYQKNTQNKEQLDRLNDSIPLEFGGFSCPAKSQLIEIKDKSSPFGEFDFFRDDDLVSILYPNVIQFDYQSPQDSPMGIILTNFEQQNDCGFGFSTVTHSFMENIENENRIISKNQMIGDAIYDMKKKFINWNLNTNLNPIASFNQDNPFNNYNIYMMQMMMMMQHQQQQQKQMQINNVPFTDKKSHDKNKKHIEKPEKNFKNVNTEYLRDESKNIMDKSRSPQKKNKKNKKDKERDRDYKQNKKDKKKINHRSRSRSRDRSKQKVYKNHSPSLRRSRSKSNKSRQRSISKYRKQKKSKNNSRFTDEKSYTEQEKTYNQFEQENQDKNKKIQQIIQLNNKEKQKVNIVTKQQQQQIQIQQQIRNSSEQDDAESSNSLQYQYYKQNSNSQQQSRGENHWTKNHINNILTKKKQ